MRGRWVPPLPDPAQDGYLPQGRASLCPQCLPAWLTGDADSRPGGTQRSRERAAGTPDFEARRGDRQERKRFERDRQEREVKIHKTKQQIQTKAQGLSSRE